MYIVYTKCDSIQFLFRHGSLLVGVYGLNELFTASQQFCGGLTACVFFVVFWLAIKISGGFTATSAKLGLAVIDCGLRVYTQITRCVCNMCSSRPHLAL